MRLQKHTAQASALQEGVIKDLVLLSCVGVHPVFVHGGGPEINTWLDKLGIQHQFKNGLRVTDGVAQDPAWCLAFLGQHSQYNCAGATMDVVEMVLGGRVNKGLVTLIQQAGGRAVGLCGKDSGIIHARQMVRPAGLQHRKQAGW